MTGCVVVPLFLVFFMGRGYNGTVQGYANVEIICGFADVVLGRYNKRNPEKEFIRYRMKKWLKELRITHYMKNGLIFLPVFFHGELTNQRFWFNLVVGFVCFCMGASAVYLVNDVKDLEKDRLHPQKRKRPVASGEITVPQALTAAAALVCLSYLVLLLGLEGIGRKPAFLVYSVYMGVNACYSVLGFKKISLLDVVLLVSGFYLRVLMGSVLTGIQISSWMYLVVITGSFFLAFGKRRNELHALGSDTRDTLSGYTESFLDKAMYASMTMAVVFFSLWCMQEDDQHILLVPVLLVLCFRYSMDVETEESDGDPMSTILKDRVLLALGLLLGFMFLAMMYI